MNIRIDRQADEAIYRQIASQIRTHITTGHLPTGTRLPTVRQLAEQLGINRLTVQNAYQELQADGWVESIVGRGTFVKPHYPFLHPYRTLDCELTPNNMIVDLQTHMQKNGLRSLASAVPDLSLAPVDEIMGMLHSLRFDAVGLLAYATSEGDEKLRLEINQLVSGRGIYTQPDKLFTTSGSTQALYMILASHTQPGDAILLQEPNHIGLIHTLQVLKLKLVPFAVHDDDPDWDGIRSAVQQHRPRFLYLSTFNNPDGTLLSLDARRMLLQLAEECDFYIIEGDVYGLLAYDAEPPLPIKAMDRGQRVFYISSFSQVLIPGLRCGYAIVPQESREQFLALRRAIDVSSPTLMERALALYLAGGRFGGHVEKMRGVYRARRDALLSALQSFMPHGTSWTKPGGGFSCWVTLPVGTMRDIYRECLEMGIAFTPGDIFFLQKPSNRHFRLCFSTQTEGEIREIVQILGSIIRHHVRQS